MPPKSRNSVDGHGRNWMFTINNPTDEDDPKLWGAPYVVYQKEQGKGDGDTPGTVHYQGYVELEKVQRLSYLKKLNPRAHWDRRNGTQAEAVNYVTKNDTRIDGPWTLGCTLKKQGTRTDLTSLCDAMDGAASMREIRKSNREDYVRYRSNMEHYFKDVQAEASEKRKVEVFEKAILRPWQAGLKAKLDLPPDDRKIHWYWESTGNVGKTWFAKYMVSMHEAKCLPYGKMDNMAYLLPAHQGKAILFNIPRTVNPEFMSSVYTLAETIKDNMVVSYKYVPQEVDLGAQHVVIFANFEPDMTKWSPDRYDIQEIRPDPFSLSMPPLVRQKNAPVSPKFYVKKDGSKFQYAGGGGETVGLAACTSRMGAPLPVTAENNPGLFRADSPEPSTRMPPTFLSDEPPVPHVDLLKMKTPVITNFDPATFNHPDAPKPVLQGRSLQLGKDDVLEDWEIAHEPPIQSTSLFKKNPRSLDTSSISDHPTRKKRSVYCPVCDAYKPVTGHTCA